MKAKVFLFLERDEVTRAIPYALICETIGGSVWSTGKRKRAWVKEFSEDEREKCGRLYKTAYDRYLRQGVPDVVKMLPETLKLWIRLGNFCYSL